VTVCGADVVGNMNIDAGPSLQTCITQAKTPVAALPPGRYFINSTLELGSTSNITIETLGTTSGPACLDTGAGPCAILTASASNPGPWLLHSASATGLRFNHIALDGNLGVRLATLGTSAWVDGNASNGNIHNCSDCSFYGFTSIRAKNTGLGFVGDTPTASPNAVFDTVLFRDNGFGILGNGESPAAWSDGLTIEGAPNLIIRNSKFIDNSDVQLILGDVPNAVIENNKIANTHNFSFAGLMLNNWSTTETSNYQGAVVTGNTIDCGNALCGIGINVGTNPWGVEPALVGGSLTNNTVIGARQGILIGAIQGTIVNENVVIDAGNYSKADGSCLATPLAASNDTSTISGNSVPLSSYSFTNCSPQDLSTLLLNQSGTDPQIVALYRNVLSRDPDMAGGNNATTQLHSGISLATIRQSMAQSQEAQQKLNALYLEIFKRNIDSSGLASWTNALATGQATLDQIRVQLILSPEGQTHAFD